MPLILKFIFYSVCTFKFFISCSYPTVFGCCAHYIESFSLFMFECSIASTLSSISSILYLAWLMNITVCFFPKSKFHCLVCLPSCCHFHPDCWFSSHFSAIPPLLLVLFFQVPEIFLYFRHLLIYILFEVTDHFLTKEFLKATSGVWSISVFHFGNWGIMVFGGAILPCIFMFLVLQCYDLWCLMLI